MGPVGEISGRRGFGKKKKKKKKKFGGATGGTPPPFGPLEKNPGSRALFFRPPGVTGRYRFFPATARELHLLMVESQEVEPCCPSRTSTTRVLSGWQLPGPAERG